MRNINRGKYLFITLLGSILQGIESSGSFDDNERRLHALSDLGLTDYSQTKLPQPGGDIGNQDSSKANIAPYLRSFLASETEGGNSTAPLDQSPVEYNSDWVELLTLEISKSTNPGTASLELKHPESIEIASNAAFIMSMSQSTTINHTTGSSNQNSGPSSHNSPQVVERSLLEDALQQPSSNLVKPAIFQLSIPLSYKDALQKKSSEKSDTSPSSTAASSPQVPSQSLSQAQLESSSSVKKTTDEVIATPNVRARMKLRQNFIKEDRDEAIAAAAAAAENFAMSEEFDTKKKNRASGSAKGKDESPFEAPQNDAFKLSSQEGPKPLVIKSKNLKRFDPDVTVSPAVSNGQTGASSQNKSQSNRNYSTKHQKQQQQHKSNRHQQEEEIIPEGMISYERWKTLFRMPSAYTPAGDQQTFAFPSSTTENTTFLAQLAGFQDDLKHFREMSLNPASCKFENYRPQLNFFQSKITGELYTNSPLVKPFDAPPQRQWIPVRCDALGMKFGTKGAVTGHAGRPGGKTHVTIVYNINQRWADYEGGKELFYIRKTYNEIEYFTNEYNFFQFAHHRSLPKPYCVEYGSQPSIIMEYVEGERVNSVFYEMARVARNHHKRDIKTIWEEIEKHLIDVIAKIMLTLRYIHSIGFIHADLKPENILYDPLIGRVVIIDFDFSVSAPYSFAGRGSANSIAPELNGLVKGPVHFGIDWWGFGATVTMIISNIFAGILWNSADKSKELYDYAPFRLHKDHNVYIVTHIPEYFPQLWRSFIYPFFSPDPAERNFSDIYAFNWIRRHPVFGGFDWARYENPKLSLFSQIPAMVLGFMSFSQNPHLLHSTTSRGMKLINNIAGLFWKTD